MVEENQWVLGFPDDGITLYGKVVADRKDTGILGLRRRRIQSRARDEA